MKKNKKKTQGVRFDKKRFFAGVIGQLKEAEEAKRKSNCYFEKMILNEKINALRGVCTSLILMGIEATTRGGTDV